MQEVFTQLGAKLIELYKEFMNFLPASLGNFFSFFILVLLIVLYSIIIWKLYRFISRKNIIELNLNKYNRSEHPVITKVLAAMFYFIEYIVLVPFWVFIWFSIFTIFLVFMTENLSISTLLVTSGTIVAAIRMTAYYKEDLSRDLAKLLPFTLLSISVLNPNFFDIERILSHFSAIPGLFSQILAYLFFIIILEVILRIFDFIFSLFGLEEEEEEKEN